MEQGDGNNYVAYKRKMSELIAWHFSYMVFIYAYEYLTGIQRNTLPVLKKIVDFGYRFKWCGYDNTILYEIKGYKRVEDAGNNGKRIMLYDEENNK